MEILNGQVTLVTNFEVLHLVSEVKKQEEKKAKNDRSKHLSTVLYETAKYLKTTSAQEQNVEVVEKFIRAIRPYKLTAAETMQIINLRPTTAAEIQLIVEESEERIKTEEKLESLVATVSELSANKNKIQNDNCSAIGNHRRL
ncbi:RNA polymerase III subunit C17 [Necator americanus]|uniref:DNA-directed RNA polymerase III subunit RPC9 n=1 Tax=Necator americanus TaxID=51031 RepID=W2SYN2_NECAM|nr:RNA polymerase III subunit C17 [Necator americanus]ETN74041.1 RNA polymerase III subunit C17 [Necator americanus]